MSETSNSLSNFQTTFHHSVPLPAFPSKERVEETLRQHSSVWETYSNLPDNLKQELIGFCPEKNGLKITYDPIFKKIFNPYLRPKRLEAFLSAILGRTVRIIRVISREGTHLNERASFVVMDIFMEKSPRVKRY